MKKRYLLLIPLLFLLIACVGNKASSYETTGGTTQTSLTTSTGELPTSYTVRFYTNGGQFSNGYIKRVGLKTAIEYKPDEQTDYGIDKYWVVELKTEANFDENKRIEASMFADQEETENGIDKEIFRNGYVLVGWNYSDVDEQGIPTLKDPTNGVEITTSTYYMEGVNLTDNTNFVAIWQSINDIICEMLDALRSIVDSADVSSEFKQHLYELINAFETEITKPGLSNEEKITKIEQFCEEIKKLIDEELNRVTETFKKPGEILIQHGEKIPSDALVDMGHGIMDGSSAVVNQGLDKILGETANLNGQELANQLDKYIAALEEAAQAAKEQGNMPLYGALQELANALKQAKDQALKGDNQAAHESIKEGVESAKQNFADSLKESQNVADVKTDIQEVIDSALEKLHGQTGKPEDNEFIKPNPSGGNSGDSTSTSGNLTTSSLPITDILPTTEPNPTTKNSILIIAGPGEDATQLENSIISYGYKPKVVSPFDAPSTPSELCEYKEVILMNVDTVSLPYSFSSILHTYVEKFGGSVLTAGGNNTYSNGNMKGTTFEDMLPVSLTPTANNSRAIVLCLDFSNSMGMKSFDGTVLFSKTDLNFQIPQSLNGIDSRIYTAIKGIVASIEESLNPSDYLSVITFGAFNPEKGVDETNVVFGLTPVTQKRAMIEKVQSIRKPTTVGGTNYDVALEYAEDMLTNFTKKVNKKSVILINDFDNVHDDATRYMNTINRMKEKGIDMSTITIGNQKSNNVVEMEYIIGSNNSYLTQTESQFKTIIKELCRSLPTKIVNTLNTAQSFEFEEGTRIAEGINEANLPIINTYNGGVSVKEGATSHIFFHNKEIIQDPAFPNDPNKTVELDNHDPIYATWSFGYGKVGSLMIDLSGKWCPDFYTNMNTQKLLENIIKDLAPKEDKVSFMKNKNEKLSLEDNYNEKVITMNKNQKTIDFKLESDIVDKFQKDFLTIKPILYRIDISYNENNKLVKKTSYKASLYSNDTHRFYDTSVKCSRIVSVC